MSEWPTVNFERLCDASAFGPRFSSADYHPQGNVATLRTTDISEAGVITHSTMPLARLDESKFKSHYLQVGDLVITRTGRVGTTAVFTGHRMPVVPGAFLIRFRLNERVADPLFYRYFFNSPNGQQLLHSVATGSVQQNLNIPSIHGLPVPKPELDEQRAIASILGSLDDKIELNRRMNCTLEQMAAAIFKAWFVDFEPVRAKASGAASFPGMPQPVFDALPATFADSELGPIPEGWEVCDVYRLADVVYGAPFKSSQFNENRNGKPLIRIRDLKNHDPGVWTPEVHPKGTLVNSGDIIVGMDGEFRLHYWTGPQSWLNQRVCMFKPNREVPRTFLGESLRPCLDFFERSKTGTTVIHLGKGDIDTFRLLVPPAKLLSAFGLQTEPLLDLLLSNAKECCVLAETRDALLPKLLSGEVQVAKPEVAACP